MFSRALLLHDNQTTVHSRKERAGWEEVKHLIQWEMVGKAKLNGLSPLFLLLSMESIGLPHLRVTRATTSLIPCHLLQFEGTPQFDGGPLVRRLRAHFCEFTIYSSLSDKCFQIIEWSGREVWFLKARCCPVTACIMYSLLEGFESCWEFLNHKLHQRALILLQLLFHPTPTDISLTGDFVPIRGFQAWGYIRITRGHMLKMPIPWCVLQQFDLEDIKQALRIWMFR